MKTGKLKAFTLMEISMVMLLSALVIGIAYRCLDILTNQYRSFTQKNAYITQLSILDGLLSRDFVKSDTVFTTGNGIRCCSPGKTIVYMMQPDCIIRTDILRDTFFAAQEAHFFFKDEKLNFPAGMIDKLVIQFGKDQNSFTTSYTKYYAADVLMNIKQIK